MHLTVRPPSGLTREQCWARTLPVHEVPVATPARLEGTGATPARVSSTNAFPWRRSAAGEHPARRLAWRVRPPADPGGATQARRQRPVRICILIGGGDVPGLKQF